MTLTNRCLLITLALILISSPGRAEITIDGKVVEQDSQNYDSSSFDCAKSKTGAEQTICGNEDLSNYDKKMADAYNKLRTQLSSEAVTLLTLNQRQWITQRDKQCVTDVGACADIYKDRLDEFQEFSEQPSILIPYLSMHDQFARVVNMGETSYSLISHKMVGKDSHGNDIWILETSGDDDYHGRFWLFLVQSGKVVRKQYLAYLETDMGGGVEVDSGIITMHEYIGAMSGHLRSITARLDTFTLLVQDLSTQNQEDSRDEQWEWNWQQFSGQGKWLPKGDFLLVPQLPEDPGLWDKIPLGNCSLSLSSHNGFLLAGHTKPPDAAVMKAIFVSSGVLVVNVYGDTWTHGASNWLYDDHLEIWAFPSNDVNDSSADQWGISLEDGKVYPAYGQPQEKLDVRMKDLVDGNGQKIRSFRIELAKGAIRSLSYSAGDGRDKVKWLLSTSQVKYGDLSSFGETFPVDPKFATCAPENGALTIKRATKFNENEPLF